MDSAWRCPPSISVSAERRNARDEIGRCKFSNEQKETSQCEVFFQFNPILFSFTHEKKIKIHLQMSDKVPLKVSIVGGAAWGCALATIIGQNVAANRKFDDQVTMYMLEEDINGQKLSDVINTTHEDIKNLQGHKIPKNVKAHTDVKEAAKNADVLIFVLPYEAIARTCEELKNVVKPCTIAVSFIKGVDVKENGQLRFVCEFIKSYIGVECNVLMGAISPQELASNTYCEATIGSGNLSHGQILKDLMQTDNLRLRIVRDYETVELCGVLKEIVGVAADVISCVATNEDPNTPVEAIDWTRYGDNTKAAVIRLGLMEMIRFVEEFYPCGKMTTFMESCGLADLIATSYGRGNQKIAQDFQLSEKSLSDVQRQLLQTERNILGASVAASVNTVLKARSKENMFPLFTAIHKICAGELSASKFLSCLGNHPVHLAPPATHRN